MFLRCSRCKNEGDGNSGVFKYSSSLGVCKEVEAVEFGGVVNEELELVVTEVMVMGLRVCLTNPRPGLAVAV